MSIIDRYKISKLLKCIIFSGEISYCLTTRNYLYVKVRPIFRTFPEQEISWILYPQNMMLKINQYANYIYLHYEEECSQCHSEISCTITCAKWNILNWLKNEKKSKKKQMCKNFRQKRHCLKNTWKKIDKLSATA